MKDLNDEIKHLNEYENTLVVSGDTLGSTISRYIDQFFVRGRHIMFYFCYPSQPFFDSPKRTIRNNSNKTIMFNQALKNIDNIQRYVGGYGMGYDEFKQLCRISWEEDFKYLSIGRSKLRDQGRYCICNESKTHISDVLLRRMLFDYQKYCNQ